jgi:hypothetical protein
MPHHEELNDTDREIALLIRAKFPIISIVTYEESRVLSQLEGIREDLIKWRRGAINESTGTFDFRCRRARIRSKIRGVG